MSMSKEKILILANNDVGLYKFRKELIEELLHPGSVVEGRKAESKEVYISLPNGELVQLLEQMGCRFLETPIERRGINPITDVKLLLRYFKMIKSVKPDMVITYTIKPNIYGAIASRILKQNYIVNITGLGTAFQKKGMLRKIVTLMYKFALRKAKIVFFENKANQDFFVEEHIVEKNKTCVLNGAGVNLTYYTVLEYPKEREETRFLFVGRVMKEKGIEELFVAMRRLRSAGYSCTLDVLGGMEEDYRQEIEKYTAEGWLHYHGYQKDVRPFIRECHCFVLPSWHEGMANTNLECAASGRPLITSNIPGCREAVVDGVSGYLCESRNSESLYARMKQFINLTHEERQKMGLAGRKHMEEMFDKRKVVEKTIDMMRRESEKKV